MGKNLRLPLNGDASDRLVSRRKTTIQNNIEIFIKESVGQVTESDKFLIGEALYNIDKLIECKQDIDENGVVLKMTNEYKGNVINKVTPNPAVAIYDQRLRNIQNILKDLSLTPKERKGIMAELVKEEVDEFGEFD